MLKIDDISLWCSSIREFGCRLSTSNECLTNFFV